MNQINTQTQVRNNIKAKSQQMDNETINKLKQSKNILSNVAKVKKISGLKQSSIPFNSFAQSTMRSEMLSTPEQTTLNLSQHQTQNGFYSGTFNSGINSSIQHSKQNLESVRDYYFQNGVQKQNLTHANQQSQKMSLSQSDSNSSLSNKKVNIVPPLKLNYIQSQQNQLNYEESFEIGLSPFNSQTQQVQNITNKKGNTLSFFQLNNMERTSSSQKLRFDENNTVQNAIVNGFFTDRTISINSKKKIVSVQQDTPTKGILKQAVNRQRNSINLEKSDGLEPPQLLINYQEEKVPNSNFANIYKRSSLKQDNIKYDPQSNQSLEFNSLTERKFSYRLQTQQTQRRTSHQLAIRNSKENVINGYFSPISSMNHLNISDTAQQQSCISLTYIKPRSSVRLNVKTLSNQGLEDLVSKQQSLNIMSTENKQIFKRKNNLTQSSQENYQSNQKQYQSQISINNKQYQIPSISINNSPYLQNNTIQRENSNLNIKNQKNIQQNKSPQNKVVSNQNLQNSLTQVNSINNEINSLANLDLNIFPLNDKKNDQIGVKCRTEGDLFKQVFKQKAQNSISPFNQQLTSTQIGRSQSFKQKMIEQRNANIQNSSSPQKKHQNTLVTAIKFQQKQTEKLNLLTEFIKQQKQITEKNKSQFNGLSIQKQGEIITFWNYLKTRIYAKSNVELVFKKNRFDEKTIKVFISVVDKIINLYTNETHNPSHYNKISDLIEELISIISQLKIISTFFLIRFYTILGKFAYKCGNIYNSIKAFFEAKRLATLNKEYKFKMRLHKHIGHCFKLLKKFSLAKNQFIKMLTLSWVLNEKDTELASYEELGIIFYYECEIGIAKKLHQRSCLDITEDHMSKARQAAVENFKQRLRFSDQQRNVDEIETKEQQQQQEIINKIYKKPAKSKIKEQNDIEQVDFEDSSDEEADYYVREIIQREVMKDEEVQLEKMNEEKSENSKKNIKLRYSKLMQERQKNKEQEQIYQRIISTQQFSENSELEKKKNPQILISHLSRNRNLNNYIETSIKDHQFFQLKKFQQNLKNKIDNKDDNIASILIDQLKQRSSVLQLQIDQKSPTNQFSQQNFTSQPDEIEQNQTLFKFVVPPSAFKDTTTSLEKIRKQILLLLNNVEMHESQKNNVKSVSSKNALLFC